MGSAPLCEELVEADGEAEAELLTVPEPLAVLEGARVVVEVVGEAIVILLGFSVPHMSQMVELQFAWPCWLCTFAASQSANA